MIFGCDSDTMLSLDDYKKMRKNSFSSEECEVIYGIAKMFDDFQKTQNVLDNNIISHIGKTFATPGETVILEGTISKGFEYPLIGVAVLSFVVGVLAKKFLGVEI